MSLLRLLVWAACATPVLSSVAADLRAPPPLQDAQRAPAPDEDWASVCRKIDALNREMESTLRRGDLLGVARFYADDAYLLGPRGERTHGRQAIDRYWTGIRGAKDWMLTSEKLGGDRETVYQIGKSRLVTEDAGREVAHEVEFVVVWRRQADGSYRIEVDFYH